MDVREIFSVLGMEPAKDEGQIKNAYRERLRTTNPEEDPEGFKWLRSAYEEACAYARRTEEEDRTAREAQRDFTPSGLWVERAKEIYENFSDRLNPELWEELFQDDVFFSLDEEENCREKLLRFLMDHFRLPTDVWKLLDRKMSIVRDAGKLRERFRADFISFVVSKCEQGEDIDFTFFEGAPDAPYDLFLNEYDNCWRALRENKLDKAETALAAADSMQIYHPAMELLRGSLLERQGKTGEALTLMERLLKRYPGNEMVQFHVAELFWIRERRQDAAAIFLKLKAGDKAHYMANYRLTEWYYDHGDYGEAKRCAEYVLRAGAGDSFMDILMKVNAGLEPGYQKLWEEEHDWAAGLDLGWCLLQDGKISRGIRLAGELEKLVNFRPVEELAGYYGLLTKLYAEEAEYEDAICMASTWEKSLEEKLKGDSDEEERERDRDRIRQSHVIKIQCYSKLGFQDNIYFGKALEEFRYLETGTSKDIPLLLEKARLYLDMREYELCRDITDRLIMEYQVYAANATAMEAWHGQWDARGVVQCGRQCIAYYPEYIRAYELVADVYLALGYTKELEEVLQAAEKNDVKSVILDAYRYQMTHKIPTLEELNEKLKAFRKEYTRRLDAGEMEYFEKGLPILTEYLYCHPGAFMLRERGLFYRSGKHYEEALEDFEKSLLYEPASFYALRGVALTYLHMGKYEEALIYINRAILYMDQESAAEVYAEKALIYSRLGIQEKALEAYRLYEKGTGEDGRGARRVRGMAQILAGCGKVQEAYAKLYAYYAKDADPFKKYPYLVELCQTTEQESKARELLGEWQQKLGIGRWMKGRNAAAYYRCMGWQELVYGTGKAAIRFFEKMWKAGQQAGNAGEDAREEEKAGLCDLVFACILWRDGRRGRKYARILRMRQKEEEQGSRDIYYGAEKKKLSINFLADYYFAGEEELQQVFEREADAEPCRACTCGICKEIEAERVLMLLRRGRMEEAKERLEKCMGQLPADEYAMAIDHAIRHAQFYCLRRKGKGRYHDSRN